MAVVGDTVSSVEFTASPAAILVIRQVVVAVGGGRYMLSGENIGEHTYRARIGATEDEALLKKLALLIQDRDELKGQDRIAAVSDVAGFQGGPPITRRDR